jgi:PIN domain nuclease of toxin-antitoxin system
MIFLLDASTFIWWTHDAGKLSSKAFQACQDKNNRLYLSMASVWEIQLKVNLGKLQLTAPLPDLLHQQQQVNQLLLMPLLLAHVMELSLLPNIHRDPFDRMLVAQARVEGATLISSDPLIHQYPVPILWS